MKGVAKEEGWRGIPIKIPFGTFEQLLSFKFIYSNIAYVLVSLIH